MGFLGFLRGLFSKDGIITRVVEALAAGNNQRTATLSAESGGQRTLRTFHGTFLSAPDVGNSVDQAKVAQTWEHWHVEDCGGKVAFKAIHSPDRFICANPDGHVGLTFGHPDTWEQWVPRKHSDGSWSFRGFHGRWLSAKKDGSMTTVDKCDAWERFWLGQW